MSDERVAFAGFGKVRGGIYESVRISGSGKIEGDVSAKTIKVAGACKIQGNASAEELKTAGSCRVMGNIEAGEMETSGSCSVEGKVKADTFKCAGSQKIGGKLTAKYARIAGSCGVDGDVEVDKFVSEGSFRIAGLLSADDIDIRLGGNCSAREVGGERIAVRRSGRGFSWQWQGPGKLRELRKKLDHLGERFGIEVSIDIGGWESGILETELIEGDEIMLEWTRAKTVRGKQIVIGKGCEIERVEYSESLEVDESASVGEEVKL
jgi:cytoskeletal protein CcmA (bactofilin family)